jgi:hypothetical protein
MEMIDGEGSLIRKGRALGPVTSESVLSGMARPSINCLLIRRGWPPLAEPADDLDLITRLAREGPFAYSP